MLLKHGADPAARDKRGRSGKYRGALGLNIAR